MTTIQNRIMDALSDRAVFERALGLALYNGARLAEVKDRFHLALWFEGAKKKVKEQFAYDFSKDTLRVCDHCGKFMTSGYVIDNGDGHACSEECAIALYDGDEKAFREALSHADEDDCEIYYTEWE